MITLDNKKRIVTALCWPVTVLDPTKVNYNSVINDRLNIEDEWTEAKLSDLLDQIDAVDEKFSASPTKAGIKRIDDIEFDTSRSLELISKEKKRLRNEISNILDIPSNCRAGSMAGVCW